MEQYIDKLTSILNNKRTTWVLVIVIIIALSYGGWLTYLNIKGAYTSNQFATEQEEFNKNNPVAKVLPRENSFYSISYQKNGTGPISIQVNSSWPFYRNEALQYMIQTDPNVTLNHTITFPDYKLPITRAATPNGLPTGVNALDSTIKEVVSAWYPDVATLYTIDDVKFFAGNTWASATLTYIGNDQNTRDTLYIAFQQQNNEWRIVAGPALTISKSDAPDAPDDLLRAVIPSKIDAKKFQSTWVPLDDR